MKIIVLCVCVLGFALSNLVEDEIKQQLKSAVSRKLETCMAENDVTLDDWYGEEEILTDVHKKPENEEKTRKLGCTIACYLKKQDLMEDSKINQRKVHAIIDIMYATNQSAKRKVHRIARKCMKKVKNITEECEKCFSLLTCAVKAIHTEMHEEHERAEINENEETEETISM